MRHNPRSLYSTPLEQFYTLIVKLKGKCIPIWDITPAHIIPHREKVLQSNRQTKGEIYTHMRHNPRSLYSTPSEQFYTLIVKLKGKYIPIWDITPAHIIPHREKVLQSNRQTKGKIYTHMRHNPRSLYSTPLEQFYTLIVKLKAKCIPIWDITPAHFITHRENSSTI